MKESRWTEASPDCPHPELWSAPDSAAAENEVGQFLAALCILLRPVRALETGAYLGHTARAMGEALMGVGRLDSLEKDPARWRAARKATKGLPVTVHLVDSLLFEPEDVFDLMFFDSHVDLRYEEMVRFRRFASPRCVWVLHDTKYPLVAQALSALEANHVVRSSTEFPTPRGLAIGRFP